MIELKELRKSYKTGDFIQRALDGVTLNLRDNEFVAILGQSGSGKTTLLNVLGGLDHADSGDIVVNGTSTKDYSSKDWDTYRNHRIGFIFQSYNLIPHQSVLSNVELALTLSGIGRSERRERAIQALKDVGLGDHINKKPSQLSGGQMQRVAIARALVNDPEIVLADEPTGALDTDTGIQVMNILRQVASDRLVVMVTHNPELAEEYATRIVRLADGRIIGDSDPFDPATKTAVPAAAVPAAATPATAAAAPATAAAAATAPIDAREAAKGSGKASMSFLTALGLSFNNLMTKKGRTFLTAFAGSIGIIGIAAILALSNGTNNYIDDTEEEALTSYPLTITKSSFDITNLMTASYIADGADGDGSANSDVIPQSTIMSDMFAKVKSNDLAKFKTFLESSESDIADYVNTIEYDYDVTPQIYSADTSNGPVQLNPSSMSSVFSNSLSSSSLFSSSMSMSSFEQLLSDQSLVTDQYDVVEGRWPESYDEAVLVLSKGGQISDYTLYSLGFYDPEKMSTMVTQALSGEEVTVPTDTRDFTYSDAMNMQFKVVPSTNMYTYNSETETWTDHSKDNDYMVDQINNGVTLKIVGVVKPSSGESSTMSEGVYYTADLIDYLIDQAADSDVVKAQLSDSKTDIFTGESFEDLNGSGSSSSFDLSSAFSIDTSALSSAFNFGSTSSSIDMSSVDLSSLMNAETMASIFAGAPQPDFSSITIEATPEQQMAIAQAQTNLISGFMKYATANIAKYMQPDGTINYSQAYTDYLATDEGKQYYAAMQEASGAVYQTAISTAMNDYMTNQFTPYLSNAMSSLMTTALTQVVAQMSSAIQSQMSSFTIDSSAFANAFSFNMTTEDLTSLLTSYSNSDTASYDNNLSKLGYADRDNPYSIAIYSKDFEAKEKVLDIIDDYNDRMNASGNEDSAIQYSDIAGALMSSVTDIVDMISLVLIAFVSISLVVSSIMIAIITYISVLERKKEIGILRAMGASKLNVANVFNAETIIEGLIAGVFAILLVYVVSIPVNIIVDAGFDVPNVMSLPWDNALVLIIISVVLTFIAGLIPSSMASNRDPVEALRSE